MCLISTNTPHTAVSLCMLPCLISVYLRYVDNTSNQVIIYMQTDLKPNLLGWSQSKEESQLNPYRQKRSFDCISSVCLDVTVSLSSLILGNLFLLPVPLLLVIQLCLYHVKVLMCQCLLISLISMHLSLTFLTFPWIPKSPMYSRPTHLMCLWISASLTFLSLTNLSQGAAAITKEPLSKRH
jgi:hypothetical protein